MNKTRANEMVAKGLMADAGLILVNEAKTLGEWDQKRVCPVMAADTLPAELSAALQVHSSVAKIFGNLAPTYQKQYILWIATAKQPATRQRERMKRLKNWNVASAWVEMNHAAQV